MKKRILSLILALSMVLSVFPLGAFAADPPELVMKDGFPVGYSGNGWSYDKNTKTLTLTSGTYDFSFTHPQNKTGTQPVPAVRCMIEIRSGVEITGGSFGNSVTNYGTISSGTFQTMGGGVINEGTIKNGTFTDSVTNNKTISGGTFQNGCSVTNGGTISDGTFQNRCIVTNKSIISGGTFQNGCSVTNNKTISGGTFQNGCSVTNYHTIKDNGTFEGTVTNNGTIENGTFKGNVTNKTNGLIYGGTFQSTCSVTNYGTITGNGTFNGTVTNDYYIKNGTFKGDVTNKTNGIIYGGTFAGSVTNSGTVNSGVFKGKNNLTNVYAITWDTAYPNAKIEKVNDVSVDWPPYVCAGTTVTITADTDIFSLNGRLLGEGDHVNGNKNTVTFTMPGEPVVLNGAITCTDLVMENGYPKASNGGTISCSGTGWEYIKKSSGSTNTGTLYLMSGSEPFDFNFADPTTKITRTDAAVKCAIESYATISGGIFDGTVTNNAGGEISDGTFKGDVENSGYIKKGTFNGEVTNNTSGTIFGGTFRGQVDNNGKITGGIFAAGLSTTPGTVTGGIFNGNTGLTNALQVTVTNGSVLKVNGEDPRNANGTPGTAWDLYSYKDTTMTITADTEIFSLNGRLLGEGDHVNGNKNTVKFTMPDKDVVLSSGELVMQGGFPVGSNTGAADCEGTGWTYSKKDASNPKGKLTLKKSGKYDFSSTYPQNTSKGAGAEPVACAVETQLGVEITGGIFAGEVTNEGTIKNGIFAGRVTSNGTIMDNATFNEEVTNSGYIKDGTFNGEVTNSNTIENGTFAGSVTNEGTIKNGSFEKKVTNGRTIMDGVFKGVVENGGNGTIFGGTFAGRVNNSYGGHIFGGVFNGYIKVQGAGVYSITVDEASPNAKITEVNGVSAEWDPYVVVAELTMNQKVIITASTEIYSLNHKPIGAGNCNSSQDSSDKNTVKFTMPNANVVLNGAITSTDLVMENGYPKDSNGGKNPCKGDGWEYIKNDPTNGDMLLLTGSNQTGGLFDFSTIGDGSAVECNVFVGKPTAITGGEFNGKVFNNSGILGGTFHGEVDNRAPGIIKGGTFNGAVENNGIIEKGTFNGAVTGSGTVSESITGSGTLNGELITKTPEPKPKPTTYTVTVIGGTIDGKTSVSAKENDTLTVVLDQNDIPDGMTFDLWSISSSKLSGDINVDYRAEAMTFQMPAEDVTIRAQYRSAEIIEDAAPSPLATAATVAVGGAAAGIVVWQGVSLGVDLYLANALPQGVPVPTDRRALALLLWETAGKPEVALPTLYGDIPAEEIELQKATRWAVQNGLMDAADKKDASFFDPDHYVTKMDVFGAWLRLKKLLGTT